MAANRPPPGRRGCWGRRTGVDEVRSVFDTLGRAGFQAEPIFFGSNDDYVVDIHCGSTTKGTGKVDDLSGDQHQMDGFIWDDSTLAPLPDRLA
ncbi:MULTISPECIES: hypothetical protein [unclassified Streptomyces]|uniref:hypothetical protein n=1 Tax=unclassified Streptomyces TaxID=2593676 RepID=UPI002E0D2811|nr:MULTISPECIES: hypothetical protein [unclassified Streptomyces]WSR23813.1 hypothetical protein OG573_35290 [Streptomyces sp. NBC_01205]